MNGMANGVINLLHGSHSVFEPEQWLGRKDSKDLVSGELLRSTKKGSEIQRLGKKRLVCSVTCACML